MIFRFISLFVCGFNVWVILQDNGVTDAGLAGLTVILFGTIMFGAIGERK